MIQDTSFVIDVLDGDDGALDTLETIERESKPEKVSSITVLELYEGITRSGKPDEEKRQVLGVLDSKTVLPASHPTMRMAGRISGDLVSTGRRIDREDCIVAATAIREDEPVVTRNADHFGRIEGLEVRSY